MGGPDQPQPQCPISAGSSNDHLASTGLPATHPAAIAHADSIRQARVIQEAIAKKQDEERQALAGKQTLLHAEIQLAANSAAQVVLQGSSTEGGPSSASPGKPPGPLAQSVIPAPGAATAIPPASTATYGGSSSGGGSSSPQPTAPAAGTNPHRSGPPLKAPSPGPVPNRGPFKSIKNAEATELCSSPPATIAGASYATRQNSRLTAAAGDRRT